MNLTNFFCFLRAIVDIIILAAPIAPRFTLAAFGNVPLVSGGLSSIIARCQFGSDSESKEERNGGKIKTIVRPNEIPEQIEGMMVVDLRWLRDGNSLGAGDDVIPSPSSISAGDGRRRRCGRSCSAAEAAGA